MKYQSYHHLIITGLIIILILFFAYLFDIKKILNDLHQLHIKKIELKRQLKENPPSSPQVVRPVFSMQHIATLSVLMMLIAHSGMNIQAMDISSQSNDISKITLSLQGSFSEWMNWLLMIQANRLPLTIKEWSSQLTDHDEIIFSQHLLLLRDMLKRPITLLNTIDYHSLYCKKNKLFLPADVSTESIYSLKMVGFMQQGTKKQALLMLPDRHLIVVNVGDSIGKEKGKIISIARDAVMIRILNQKKVVILSVAKDH